MSAPQQVRYSAIAVGGRFRAPETFEDFAVGPIEVLVKAFDRESQVGRVRLQNNYMRYSALPPSARFPFFQGTTTNIGQESADNRRSQSLGEVGILTADGTEAMIGIHAFAPHRVNGGHRSSPVLGVQARLLDRGQNYIRVRLDRWHLTPLLLFHGGCFAASSRPLALACEVATMGLRPWRNPLDELAGPKGREDREDVLAEIPSGVTGALPSLLSCVSTTVWEADCRALHDKRSGPYEGHSWPASAKSRPPREGGRGCPGAAVDVKGTPRSNLFMSR